MICLITIQLETDFKLYCWDVLKLCGTHPPSSLPVELSIRDGSLSPRRRTRGQGEQDAGLCGGGSGGRAPAPVGEPCGMWIS